jgi:hypothetical protein
MNELAPDEQGDLARCEAAIGNGIRAFIAAGAALREIRDRRLYRAAFGTFEEYCQNRWGIGRAHAYRMIEAAMVAENVSPIGDIPANIEQTRALAGLEPDQQRVGFRRSIETAPNGKLTGEHVRRVVDELFPRAGPPSAATGPPPRPGQASSGLVTRGSVTNTKRLKAPFPYFGGKAAVAGLAWERFGNVRNYIEPFAGSAAVLLARPHPPQIETLNDKDCFVSNFWRAIQWDPEAVAVHADWPVNEADLYARHRWLVLSPEARAIRERIREDPEFYDPKVAGWWCWGMCSYIGSGWCRVDEDIEDVDDKRPQLCVGNTRHGPGVRRRVDDKMPRLTGGRKGDLYFPGLGVHAEMHLDVGDGRPQLADAYSRGRGVHGHDAAETCAARREWLIGWFQQLGDRLRPVRVCCGNWLRVCDSESVTTRLGLTGIFFDPPYSREAGRSKDLYGVDSETVARDVRAYCLERGSDPMMRIVLAGYEGEGHEQLEAAGWSVIAWKAQGGYGNRSEKGQKNAARERLWFSPHCLDPEQERWPLFAGLDRAEEVPG